MLDKKVYLMPSPFHTLSVKEQKDQIIVCGQALGISEVAIEKDIWICWILEKLFLLDMPLVFKGGTTLSKVFNLVNRYSEDIDISIEYSNFLDYQIDFDVKHTDREREKFRRDLYQAITGYLTKTVLPHLQAEYAKDFPNGKGSFNLRYKTYMKDGRDYAEEIEFLYPKIFDSMGGLLDFVKIEFNLRNTSDPFESHNVSSYVDDFYEIGYAVKANVLSPVRTFWEKATLIHVECNKKVSRLVDPKARQARHWYDLYKLANSDIVKKALNNKEVLDLVIKTKQIFYYYGDATYESCSNGNIKLIPDEKGIEGLRQDYQGMVDSRLFFETEPTFDEIISSLHALENKINA